jgi:competence protein ComEA
MHYLKALPVRQVIQDSGGLASNRSIPAVEAAQVLSRDTTLDIGSHSEEGAPVRSGPLSNRARWILGRPIPLNQAAAEDLDRLPGVGPELAWRIIACREARRGFSSLEELKQVEGLKEKTFDKIKNLLTLSDEKT